MVDRQGGASRPDDGHLTAGVNRSHAGVGGAVTQRSRPLRGGPQVKRGIPKSLRRTNVSHGDALEGLVDHQAHRVGQRRDVVVGVGVRGREDSCQGVGSGVQDRPVGWAVDKASIHGTGGVELSSRKGRPVGNRERITPGDQRCRLGYRVSDVLRRGGVGDLIHHGHLGGISSRVHGGVGGAGDRGRVPVRHFDRRGARRGRGSDRMG